MLRKLHNLVVSCDHTIWYYMNTQWHNTFLDAVIPWLRNPWFWAPLYLFLAIFIPARFRKQGLIWCVLFLVSFALSDQISVNIIKPHFHRLRPCNNPSLASIIHLLVECGGGYSFPSAHAANHFSMGVFIAVTLHKQAKWIAPVAILWALLVSFAQVYVGVHYPLDVTCGALLGIAIGLCTGKFYNRYFSLNKNIAITPETH